MFFPKSDAKKSTLRRYFQEWVEMSCETFSDHAQNRSRVGSYNVLSRIFLVGVSDDSRTVISTQEWVEPTILRKMPDFFFGHSPETFLSNLRSWKCSPLISYPLWTTLGSLRAFKDRGSALRGRPIDWNHDQLLDENWLKTGFWKEIPSSFVFLSIPDKLFDKQHSVATLERICIPSRRLIWLFARKLGNPASDRQETAK